MLTKELNTTKLVTVILLLVVLTSSLFARPIQTLGEKIKSGLTEKAARSLAMGIESENAGVKKSCIYFAGLYEIREVVGTLIKQLKKEPDPDTRILIALSLYKIGDKEALNAVEKLIKSDSDYKVKKMSSAILNQFKIDMSGKNSLSTINK
jgi:HEAT repeat protein